MRRRLFHLGANNRSGSVVLLILTTLSDVK